MISYHSRLALRRPIQPVARWATNAGALAALTLTVLVSGLPAQAQEKSCCNLATGQFEAAASPEACEATGDRVALGSSPDSFMRAAICFQNVTQQAQEALGNTGVDLSTLPETSPTPADAMALLQQMQGGPSGAGSYACCNLSAAAFVGSMTVAACRAKGADHLPDTPENLAAVQACRKPSSTGGAWNKEAFVENIEGGDFETWKDDHRPRGFASYGVPASVLASRDALDMQTTFRTSDAHTGSAALRLKNFDFLSVVPAREAAIARAALGAKAPSAAAGVFSCKDPCPENPDAAGGAGPDVFAALDATAIETHVCAAYKGYIASGDELSLNVVAFSGGEAIGGINDSPSAENVITDSSAEWVRFAVPITAPNQALPDKGRVGLQAAVRPRNMMQDVTTSGMAGQVSTETDLIIDSIHFCSLVDLTAYRSAAIAGQEDEEIPDSEEATLGVQAFVNLDNDDQDRHWDHEDPDGVAGDDDLVRLRLELPMNSFGTVELKAPGLGTRYRLWDDADKSRPFELANQELEVEELLRADGQGVRFLRDVWLEAIAPSTAPGDEAIVFSFKNRLNQDKEVADKIVLTALGVEEVTWQGAGAAAAIDDDPSWPATAEGQGKRVFPGKRWEGGAPSGQSQQEVVVEVKLTAKPVRPVELHLKSFDVDDPSSEDPIIDDESEADDNRHDVDPGPAGIFVDSGKETHSLTMAEQSARTGFKVGLRPGDNYRVVVGVDEAQLADMENNDKELAKHGPRHTTKVVDPDLLAETGSVLDSRIREHVHYESPVLTVWRRLHAEVDNMGPVAENDEKVGVVKVIPTGDWTADPGPAKQQSRLQLDANLFDELPKESRSERLYHRNSFHRGKMRLGSEEFEITGNSSNSNGSDDEIRVAYDKTRKALTEDDFKNLQVTLEDNDPQRDGDPVPPINFTLTDSELARAYIELDRKTLPNSSQPVPFILHFKDDQQTYLKPLFAKHFQNKGLDDDPEFWVVYVLNAYQGMLREDGDGNKDTGAISGQTDANQSGPNAGANGYGIVVFQESGRELAEDRGTAGWALDTTPAHEIAHLFRSTHAHGDIMDFEMNNRRPEYSPTTLNLLRSTEYP